MSRALPHPGVEIGGEPRRHGVDAVDADAARQRADGLAVADVDADVRAAAPDDQVARLRVAPAGEVMRPVPVVEGPRRPRRGGGPCDRRRGGTRRSRGPSSRTTEGPWRRSASAAPRCCIAIRMICWASVRGVAAATGVAGTSERKSGSCESHGDERSCAHGEGTQPLLLPASRRAGARRRIDRAAGARARRGSVGDAGSRTKTTDRRDRPIHDRHAAADRVIGRDAVRAACVVGPSS